MRILLYSRAFPPAIGGMERFAENLADWLAAGGHEVTVATRTAGPLERDRARPYHVLRGAGVGAIFRAARRAEAVHVNGLALRGLVPAVSAGRRPIVTHEGHQAICPTGLAWAAGRRCTAGPAPGPCASCPRNGMSGTATVKVHRVGAHVAAANVCASRYLERRLGLPRSVAVYNPVSAEFFESAASPVDDTAPVVFAGRLVAEKGLDLLIRAVAGLPHTRLEIAGDGPMRSEYEALARGVAVLDRVRFHGALSLEGVVELYARASVVCVPSVCPEAFGYSAAEAMALGKAVVSTPGGALTELLGEGRGFVAQAATPEAFAASLATALLDQGARARAARLAQAFARRELSIDVIGPLYVRQYENAA